MAAAHSSFHRVKDALSRGGSVAPAGRGSALGRSRVHLRPLAPAAPRFGLLLPALDARLHVVTPHLQLAKHALRGDLPLQVFDGALDALVAHGDLQGLALNRITRHGISREETE